MRFGHVHFPVSDLARSVEFYRNALSLQVSLYIEGNMGAFDVGLVLDQVHGEALMRLHVQAESVHPGPAITAVTFAIDVEDVDAAYERLKAKGIGLGDPPRDQPWGARNFYLRDPDGYVIEFNRTQHPRPG